MSEYLCVCVCVFLSAIYAGWPLLRGSLHFSVHTRTAVFRRVDAGTPAQPVLLLFLQSTAVSHHNQGKDPQYSSTTTVHQIIRIVRGLSPLKPNQRGL